MRLCKAVNVIAVAGVTMPVASLRQRWVHKVQQGGQQVLPGSKYSVSVRDSGACTALALQRGHCPEPLGEEPILCMGTSLCRLGCIKGKGATARTIS